MSTSIERLKGLRLAILFIPLLGATYMHGQFTYVGAEFGYSTMLLKKASFHQAMAGLSIQYRPVNWGALGLSVSGPMVGRGVGSFDFFEGSSGRNVAYKPSVYDHTITRGAVVALNLRGFFGSSANAFVDLRLSRTVMTERLVARRPYVPEDRSGASLYYAAIPELDLNYSSTLTIYAPGLAVGVMPHISDKFYLSASVALDAYLFSDGGYTYFVPYRGAFFEDRHDIRDMKSPLSSTQLSWFFTTGFGMHF